MADIDFGQISEALNDKADRDLMNATLNNIKPIIMNWMLPDYTRVIPNIAPPYTAPEAGYVVWSNSGPRNCSVNGYTVLFAGNDSYNEGPVLLLVGGGAMSSVLAWTRTIHALFH